MIDRTNKGSAEYGIRDVLEIESIYNSAPVGLCVFDDQLRYVRINDKLAEMNGVPAEEHIGRTPREIIPDLAEQAEAICRKIMETGDAVSDIQFIGETDAQPGIVRTWMSQWLPLKHKDGRIIGISVVAEEITERKRIKEELEDNEEKYRTWIEESIEGIAVAVGPPPKLVFANSALGKMLRYSREELLTMSPQEIYELLHPDDREMFFRRFADRIAGKEAPSRYEVRGITKNRKTIWLEISSKLINYLGKPAVQAFLVDITERKMAEESVKRASQELELLVQERTAELKILSQRLIEAQETERRHVALELHDDIGGRLLAVKMAVEAKLSDIRKGKKVPESTGLEEILDLVRTCMSETGRMQQNLRPATLDHLGLASALRGLCREFGERHDGITATAHMLGIDEVRVPERLKITIFRITQEALNNAAKHSGAKKVDLSVTHQDGEIQLTIRDDGRGFEVEKAFSPEKIRRGIGLVSMRERCNLARGSFSIDSQEGQGTAIHCSWADQKRSS